MLDSDSAPKTLGWEPMPLDMLQGFLFGIASAPVEVVQSEWLPRALGADVWPDERSEAAEWIDLVVRYYHQQIRALEGAEDAALVFFEDTPGVSNRFEHWCIGYLDGIDLAAPAWESAGSAQEVNELLFPFHVLADALHPEERVRYTDRNWARLVEECTEDLWPAVVAAWKYGLALRNRPPTVKRAAPKVGRNDPCLCGSGRKFKNCCAKT